jgi:hypothetical protein
MSYLEYRRALKNGQKPPAEKPEPNKIAQVSEKREAQNREYAKKSRPFWKGKRCQAQLPGCTGNAEGVHHLKGKSSVELLMDESNWMAVCNHCNGQIEVNDAAARDLGLKKSKFKKP